MNTNATFTLHCATRGLWLRRTCGLDPEKLDTRRPRTACKPSRGARRRGACVNGTPARDENMWMILTNRRTHSSPFQWLNDECCPRMDGRGMCAMWKGLCQQSLLRVNGTLYWMTHCGWLWRSVECIRVSELGPFCVSGGWMLVSNRWMWDVCNVRWVEFACYRNGKYRRLNISLFSWWAGWDCTQCDDKLVILSVYRQKPVLFCCTWLAAKNC